MTQFLTRLHGPEYVLSGRGSMLGAAAPVGRSESHVSTEKAISGESEDIAARDEFRRDGAGWFSAEQITSWSEVVELSCFSAS